MRRSPCRIGVASITPSGQPRDPATADQWASSPQPVRSGGNGSSSGKLTAANAQTGPISTNAVSRTTLPGRRRVTAKAACERHR